LLRDKVIDVAVVAAEMVIANGIEIRKPVKEIHDRAQFVLKQAGLIGKIQSGKCPVSDAVVEVIGHPLNVMQWKKVLGKSYKEMLLKVVRWRGYEKSDATAWINLTDVINDILLNALFAHNPSIGIYTIGQIGSVLNPASRFAKKYPSLFDAVKEVHEKRLESDLSHPITKATGKPTTYVKFKDLPHIKRKLGSGYLELWNNW